jgi:uncharacterized radical SAM superfamily protein
MTDSNQTPTVTAGLDSSSIKLDEEAIDILQEATSLVEENAAKSTVIERLTRI